MASSPNFKRIYEGLKIIAKSAATSVGLGEFEVSSVTSKVSYHNGTTSSPVVTEDHTATLTNKSLSGLSNTITQLDNNSISNNAGIQLSKLQTVNPGDILIGTTGSGVITATPISGKIVITSTGQTSINPADLLVDTDIDPSANISRTKLLVGTPNVILANDGFGIMNETTVTPADLEVAAGDSILTTVTLVNNATTDFIVTPHATNNVLHIKYSIKRDSTYEAGLITVITDGTNSSIAQGGVVTIGDVGVTISVLASGANLNVRGTATNTGLDATIKFKQVKWLS